MIRFSFGGLIASKKVTKFSHGEPPSNKGSINSVGMQSGLICV